MNAQADNFSDVMVLAKRNSFKPSNRVVTAIVNAAETYQLDPVELASIAVLETGMGKFNKSRLNKNGTIDKGIFQINTVNAKTCIEYNLDSIEGSSLCAAKLLKSIKNRFKKDPKAVARYHSGTKKFKDIYYSKLTKVLLANAD